MHICEISDVPLFRLGEQIKIRKGSEMPKKITIVSAAALVLLIGVIILAATLSRKKTSDIPAKISVYDRGASVIYTPDYDDFLAGCVEGLLINNITFEPEALKAIAIAENTRIMYFLKQNNGFDDLGADITVSDRIPYIHEAARPEVKEAAKSALSYTLTFEDEPFNAPICKISTGRTDECPPYSPSVGLPCDINAPGYEGRSEFTPEEVRSALNGGNLTYNFIEWLHDPVYSENGTLLFIDLADEKVSGETLRSALKLRSTAISAEFFEDRFIFKCQGWGDNRGMSVYAANYLAQKGMTAEEILNIFYPNAELSAVK